MSATSSNQETTTSSLQPTSIMSSRFDQVDHLSDLLPQTINVNKINRDSIAHAQGVGGVSWGSLTVGSWLKDEVMFHANISDFNTINSNSNAININNNNVSLNIERSSFSKPNFNNNKLHSTSPHSHNIYLPNLEKQYCKDYSCCGISLPGLHDLLKHYEDAHIEIHPNLDNGHRIPNSNNSASDKINKFANRKEQSFGNISKPYNIMNSSHALSSNQSTIAGSITNHQDFKYSGKNFTTNKKLSMQTTSNNLSPNRNGSSSNDNDSSPLSVNVNNNLLDTVSTKEVFLNPFDKKLSNFKNQKINYDLSTNPLTPQPSFNDTTKNQNKTYNDINLSRNNYSTNSFTSTSTHSTSSSSIFNPLSLQKSGSTSNTLVSYNNQGVAHNVIADESESDSDSDDDIDGGSEMNTSNVPEGYIDDPARRLYVMDQDTDKPFKCPVIGCDKTYKNQNGLKYHKLHGHQNQKLHENSDGSFSILDPHSNELLTDDSNNEKNKPYRCEVCGKRYKNLNGLKYHRGHSTH
ncbi:hypothetical protein Kpol_1055p71 [Vanderwaltozyma polyspora DSM 70294]|uniref:C2H2-type domain-containing protein n=1 Tax=Vanderwaltozyma polyspora (strain ATCC 22028 / DSM 70294 / BCRC 21397 / CBS 2163 / NBRC 10782 / NRRL Y-8283 / UCD 57-17) TaxID=436907 RepID=A7TGE4_VANPO|nr:uncharacterized protein Kpol_1055p71 [Vanderwaltozyma polyspora DSM 70294]EDO18714.1 hypothetical protein Kpol_1055p71 [Vanderwaltozyma polyspora DSM 70294]